MCRRGHSLGFLSPSWQCMYNPIKFELINFTIAELKNHIFLLFLKFLMSLVSPFIELPEPLPLPPLVLLSLSCELFSSPSESPLSSYDGCYVMFYWSVTAKKIMERKKLTLLILLVLCRHFDFFNYFWDWTLVLLGVW